MLLITGILTLMMGYLRVAFYLRVLVEYVGTLFVSSTRVPASYPTILLGQMAMLTFLAIGLYFMMAGPGT